VPKIDPAKLERLKAGCLTVWRELRGVMIFVVLMVMFRSAVADWSDVPTGSMKPTIIEGDRIFVNKLAYDLRLPLTHFSLWRRAEPQRGDIIIFDSRELDLRLVKRVIGLPGDVVEVRQDIVHVNGEALDYALPEPASQTGQGGIAGPGGRNGYVRDMVERFSSEDTGHLVRLARGGSLSSFSAVTVPADSYFVLGDNRDNSADSRVIGFVPRAEIVGRSSAVVLSLDYEHSWMPRSDRFFRPL